MQLTWRMASLLGLAHPSTGMLLQQPHNRSEGDSCPHMVLLGRMVSFCFRVSLYSMLELCRRGVFGFSIPSGSFNNVSSHLPGASRGWPTLWRVTPLKQVASIVTCEE